MHDMYIGSILVYIIIAQYIHKGSSARVRISPKECVATQEGVVPELMIGGLGVYIISITRWRWTLGVDQTAEVTLHQVGTSSY